MWSLGFIALGGAFGACLRYGISELMALLLGRSFPFGTFTVNVLGSFIMGVVIALLQEQVLPTDPWKPLITVGLLGALTTFSSFALDNILMLQQGEYIKVGVNILLNVIVCLIAVYVGMQLILARV